VLLKIDLGGRAIERMPVEEGVLGRFLGGSGLGAWLLFERGGWAADPLGPGNPLMILTGPLTGSGFPGSSRFTVCARSPLTGIWGEASCGGNFGPELKNAGYDGILVEGASSTPVYLLVEDGRVELRDASALWGRDTYQATDELKAALGPAFKVLCIGPAGENGVPYASIANDKAHYAARTGMGAVMGAKRLKAVAVRGGGQAALADPQEFRRARGAALKGIRESMLAESLRSMGTDSNMDLGLMTGDVPIRNWTSGESSGLAERLGGPILRERFLLRPHSCTHCPIGCKRVVAVGDGPYRTGEGPGPEYETCCTFGTLIGNGDLAAAIAANELCNRLGMDTISCGATVAMAIECFETGLLAPADTGGLELRWGGIDAVLALLPRIARREGFGGLVAGGVARLAERLGPRAAELALHVKGLELPMHDPRAFHGMGLAYVYSSRGACHNQHSVLPVEQGMAVFAGLGLQEDYPAQESRGKAPMVVVSENYGLLCNCLCHCHFVNYVTSPADLLAALNAAAGWRLDLEGLLACGARIWHLKRGLINLMGVRDRDDTLPPRVLTPLADGAAAGSVPDIEAMKEEYRALRGLDPQGIPTPQALRSLQLDELDRRLAALRI
jgi:aldehyde:ferredoxin oxidoreductase